jgi:predicted DNA-binding ribbon-helix-helix protein
VWNRSEPIRLLTSDVSSHSIRCVRTTVDIEDPVLKELRTMQKREGGTLGALMSRLLAQAIAHQSRGPVRTSFAWTARAMRARLDLSDKEAVLAVLDDSSPGEEP